jgi:hypothetical protein
MVYLLISKLKPRGAEKGGIRGLYDTMLLTVRKTGEQRRRTGSTFSPWIREGRAEARPASQFLPLFLLLFFFCPLLFPSSSSSLDGGIRGLTADAMRISTTVRKGSEGSEHRRRTGVRILSPSYSEPKNRCPSSWRVE